MARNSASAFWDLIQKASLLLGLIVAIRSLSSGR